MNVCCTQRVCCRWRWRSLRLVAFYQQASPTLVLNLTWAATRKQVKLVDWNEIVRFTCFSAYYDSTRIALTMSVQKWWVHCRLLSHLLSSCWVSARSTCRMERLTAPSASLHALNNCLTKPWPTFSARPRVSLYIYYCKKLNSLKHLVRTTVAESHN